MTTIQTTGTAPLQIGQSRSYAAGQTHLLTVSRTTAGYVVTVTRDGHDLPCYTSVFALDNVPVDMTPRVAAFVYMAGLYNEFVTEAPAPAVQPAPVEDAMPDRWYRIMLAANANGGIIRPGRDCTTADLRGLARRGYLTLETTGSRIRKGEVTGDGRVALQAEYTARRNGRTQIAA